jgi:hypothetical protein
MGSSKRFFLGLEERSEDRPPLAVTIGLLFLGFYLVIRSLVLSPGLSYSVIILTPDVQAARAVDPEESKQIVIDSLRADGVDVSETAVAQDIENLADAIRTLNLARRAFDAAWPNLARSLDSVLAHSRPRGHRESILDAVARDVKKSSASVRRRWVEHLENKSVAAAPGLFEALRTEAIQKYEEPQTNDSEG